METHKAGSLLGSLGKSWVLWGDLFSEGLNLDQLKRRWEHPGWWGSRVIDSLSLSINGLPGKPSQVNVLFYCFAEVRSAAKEWIAWNMFVFVSASDRRGWQWGGGPSSDRCVWCHYWVNEELVCQIQQKMQKACVCEMDLASESRMAHEPGFWVTGA